LPVEADTVEEGGNLEVGIRPEDFSLSDTDKGMPMKVEVVEHLGGSTMVYGSVADHLNFCALLPGDTEVSDDSVVKLEVNPASMHVFNSNGDAMRRREIPAMHR
jgi:multiple sugar transport system ATP-binding protein